MTVAITRLDLSSADLREAAARTPDAKATRRMLAIALLLEGWSREAAAETCAMESGGSVYLNSVSAWISGTSAGFRLPRSAACH